MKKYVFILFLAALAAALGLRAWGAASACAAALFAWLAFETRRRTRFRFLRGRGVEEHSFDLGADPAQAEISGDGSCALFVTVDHALSMRDAKGRELWKRPMEPHTLAVLPLPGGSAYFAVEDEVILTDERGAAIARRAFAPPPFRQAYHLILSRDRSVLLLHTPWFLQFLAPDLSALGPRIPAEATGHYMKHCALSPDASLVAFAGAKLLEEGESTEARWGAWKREGDAWKPAWAQAVDTYGNSHLRGLAFSSDGSRLLVEIFHEGYQFRLLKPDSGEVLWQRSGEHPVLSPDASLILWESPFDGATLSEVSSQAKLWSHKPGEQIRHMAVNAAGESLILEGRSLKKFDKSGALIWESAFEADPYRFNAAELSKGSLALLRQSKAAMLRVPF